MEYRQGLRYFSIGDQHKMPRPHYNQSIYSATIHFKGSPVYTPKDKGLWMLAKLSVQSADLGYNQVAEHLAKTHLLMEPFCVSKDRQLSQWHPLHQILKYHCRGVSITDKLAFKILLGKNGSLHKLFAYGYYGAASVGLRSFRQTSWKDTNFLENIKVQPLIAFGAFLVCFDGFQSREEP